MADDTLTPKLAAIVLPNPAKIECCDSAVATGGAYHKPGCPGDDANAQPMIQLWHALSGAQKPSDASLGRCEHGALAAYCTADH